MKDFFDFVKWVFSNRIRGLSAVLVFLLALLIVPFYLDRILALVIAAAATLWLLKQAGKMFG